MKISSLAFCLLVWLACRPENKPAAATQETTPAAAETTQVQAPAPAVKDSFPAGVLIDSVALRQEPAQHFALYLPKDYDSKKQYPLIIFFDPQGVGQHPVNLYRKLADKYHFILAGSNDSKNGLSSPQTMQIANNLVSDLRQRLPVDAGRLALCGHSGGAKVALLSGAANTAVTAVIYSGAATAVTPNHTFTLIGFGGTHDMNYTDLVAFEWSLKQSALPHYFFEWEGEHEFPAAEVFKDAFELISKGWMDPDPAKSISITPEKLNEEQQIKQQYITDFQQKDLNWWKAEVTRLNTLKKQDIMYERLLGFISLACYSFVSRALQQNDLGTAAQALELYKIADPQNRSIPGFEAELQQRRAGQK